MKNLLPDFILNKYKNNVFEGRMKAFAIFADISGFTPMTEKFMRHGNEGAEKLSEILKEIFRPTVKCVYRIGGFITNYAGDSFTSIIPVTERENPSDGYSLRALHCAGNILNEFKKFSTIKTEFGDVDLKVRIGMSIGDVEWGIIGKEYKSFYFRGDAINECANVQKKTKENEILYHDNIYRIFKKNKLGFSKKGNYYYLKDLPADQDRTVTNLNGNASNLTRDIFSKNFFPDNIFSAKETGEIRDVASVFISFDPGLSKEHIEGLFRIITDAINHYSGYLKDIEFGDKGGVIVCYFGAPVSYEKDAQRAISFVNFAKNKLSEEERLIELKLKIGITYGKVFTGFIGSDERIQYSVLGNLVNLSARFMSKAGWNEVWISEEAYRRIKNKNDFISIGNHAFKGFQNEIPVYKSLEKSAEVTATSVKELSHRPSVHSGRMIGREKDIGKLTECTDKIFEKGTSGIIYIIGEAGIGKSRLIKEFRAEYSRSNKLTWLYCYASEILNSPLLPFKYLLKNFFKQSASNSSDENKRVFDNIIDIIVKRLENLSIENKERSSEYLQIRNELLRTNSILAAMIDIYWDNSLYEQLEPELRFENTLFAICNFIMAECMLQPVVLELEDIHWLDKDSREVLKMLLNNITSLPLSIICTSRHLLQRRKILTDNNKEHYEILLGYLNRDEIKDFTKEILHNIIDDTAADFIFRNTNGNPYFVEQMILDMNEKNFWKIKNKVLSLSDYDEQNIPSSINSVLISRFDRLPDIVKIAVQTASVLGREFELRVLKHMFPDDIELESKIKIAEDEKIWYSGDEGKYVFTHALLCKAVYEMQMKSVVNNLHLQASESVKKLSGKKISHHNSEQIAYHLGLGQNIVNFKNRSLLTREKLKNPEYSKRVQEYLQLQISIADKYKTDYRNEKALEIYDMILALSDKLNDKEQSYNVLLKKVEILNNISRWDEAKKEADRAMKIAKEVKDKYKEMLALKFIAEVYYHMNEYKKSLISYKKSFIYFEKINMKENIISILCGMGRIYQVNGNYKKAIIEFTKQLFLSRKIKDSRQIGIALYNLGFTFRRKGEFHNALRYFFKSLKIFLILKDKSNIAFLKNGLAHIYYFKGYYKKSLSMFEQAKSKFLFVGNQNMVAVIIGNIGNLYLTLKEFDKANSYYIKQLQIFKSINNLIGIANTYSNLGNLNKDNGDYGKALIFYRNQLSIFKKLNRKESVSDSISNMGIIYVYQGNYKKALKAFNTQLKIDESLSNIDGIIRAYLNIANVYKDLNNFVLADKFYKSALKEKSKFGFNNFFFETYYNYSQVLLSQMKFKEARSILNQVLKSNLKISNPTLKIEADILLQIIIMHKLIYKLENKTKDKNVLPYIKFRINKVEILINKLNDIEAKADAYFELYEITKLIRKFFTDFDNHGMYKIKSQELLTSLFLKYPKYQFKMRLSKLKNNK